MTQPLVSILIVNWNGKKHLKTCLASLEGISYPNYEIALVDNGSTDGSVIFVKQKYPAVRIVKNDHNLGFAKANNQGFKKTRGKYVLLLNNDTRVEPGFFNPLVQRVEDEPRIGAVQPLILFWNGQKIQSTGSFFTPNGFLYHRHHHAPRTKVNKTEPSPIFAANGSALLLRRGLIEKIGLFDEDYYMYFEESDLCHRIWLSGHRVIFEPQSVVYHRGRATSQKIARPTVQFHSFKNRLQTYLKNLETRQLLTTLPRHLLYMQVASFAYLTMKKSLFLAWAVQKALLWNLTHLSQTLQKRRRIQQEIRRVPDKDFLPLLTRRVPLSYHHRLLKGKKTND